MDKKLFVEAEYFTNNNNAETNFINAVQITNDDLVNDFLNKNISLDSLIEKQIYNNN